MSKGKLIVIEGACDGIGKSTQYSKLNDALTKLGYEVIKHHFPSYKTIHGRMVEEYLAGNLGDKNELSPYYIHSLYAIDRATTWITELKEHYDKGKIILLDRYTTSSIIYQSSVIKDLEEKKKFIDFVNDYEYNKLGIAKPDLVIFLDANFDVVTELRSHRKDQEGISNDVHESDLEYMRGVYDNSRFVADYLGFSRVECSSDKKMRDIEEIHEEIKTKVLRKIEE